MSLSPQRLKFALAYLKTSNATEAALAAGYSRHTARKQGSRLLTKVDIQRFLGGRVAKVHIEADRLFGEVARQGFEDIPDPGDLVDAQGNFRPLSELTPEQRRCIASVEVMKRNLPAGDGHVYTVLKIKYWNIRAERIKALELLAKIMRMLNNIPSEAPQVSIFQVNCLPALSPDPEIERERATLVSGT